MAGVDLAAINDHIGGTDNLVAAAVAVTMRFVVPPPGR